MGLIGLNDWRSRSFSQEDPVKTFLLDITRSKNETCTDK